MEKTFFKKTPIDTEEGWQLTKLTVDLKQKVMIEEWKVPCNSQSQRGEDGHDDKDNKSKHSERSRTPGRSQAPGTPVLSPPRERSRRSSRTPEITR